MWYISITQGIPNEKQLLGDNVAQIGGDSMGASPKTTDLTNHH